MAWVFLRHADTDGAGLYSSEATLIQMLEARGWTRHAMPDGLDPDDPYAPLALAEVLAEQPVTEPVLTEEQVEALKGKGLEEALKAAGLPITGSADDKRKALAEHEAALVESPIDPEHEAEPATDNNENEGVTSG